MRKQKTRTETEEQKGIWKKVKGKTVEVGCREAASDRTIQKDKFTVMQIM